MNVSAKRTVARQMAALLVLLSTAAACRPERVMPYHASLGLSRQEYIDACNHKPGARMRLYGCAKWVSELRPGPLFVVDGRPIPPRVSGWPFRRRYKTTIEIEPDSIAELHVLKGAVAVAKYGKKARNGVVVLTTKRAVAALAVDSLPLAPACYELMPGPWQTDSLLRGIVNPLGAPRRFKLDTARLAGWDELQERFSFPMHVVHAYVDSGQSAHVFTYWARTSSQSNAIRVGYPLPLAGVMLELTPVDSGLAGRMVGFTDFVQPGKPSSASAPIVARRITCPQ